MMKKLRNQESVKKSIKKVYARLLNDLACKSYKIREVSVFGVVYSFYSCPIRTCQRISLHTAKESLNYGTPYLALHFIEINESTLEKITDAILNNLKCLYERQAAEVMES